MRIVVLAGPNSWYLRDLQRAAGRHEIVGADHARLSSSLGNSGLCFCAGSVLLDDADAVVVRTMEGGSLEQVVFRMDVLGQLEATGKVVVNSPRAVEAAVDKYLAAAKCRAAGLQIPATCVCQTIDDALQAFAELGGDVVVKPLFGGEGRGLFRVSDPDCAWRCFKALTRIDAAIYLQEYIPHAGFDLRLFIVGERVLGMRRVNHSDWRSNVSRGASTEPVDVTDELQEIARCASSAVHTEIAGVDVLPGRDGKLYVLEVNAVPGWRALARTLRIDVAELVIEHVTTLVNRRE